MSTSASTYRLQIRMSTRFFNTCRLADKFNKTIYLIKWFACGGNGYCKIDVGVMLTSIGAKKPSTAALTSEDACIDPGPGDCPTPDRLGDSQSTGSIEPTASLDGSSLKLTKATADPFDTSPVPTASAVVCNLNRAEVNSHLSKTLGAPPLSNRKLKQAGDTDCRKGKQHAVERNQETASRGV